MKAKRALFERDPAVGRLCVYEDGYLYLTLVRRVVEDLSSSYVRLESPEVDYQSGGNELYLEKGPNRVI